MKGKVKVNAFNQHISRNNRLVFTEINYRGIVTNTFHRLLIPELNGFCNVLDQAEFSQCAHFCPLVLVFKHVPEFGLQTCMIFFKGKINDLKNISLPALILPRRNPKYNVRKVPQLPVFMKYLILM